MASPGATGSFDALAAAVLAERDANARLRAARAELAALIIDQVKTGALYDALARVSIRATKGRSASPAERRREVDRLRQIACRYRMKARHEDVSQEFEPHPPVAARSTGKEIAMEKLLKRTTIEETFSVEDTDRDLAAANREDDPREEDDEGDEDDGKPSRGSRARR